MHNCILKVLYIQGDFKNGNALAITIVHKLCAVTEGITKFYNICKEISCKLWYQKQIIGR